MWPTASRPRIGLVVSILLTCSSGLPAQVERPLRLRSPGTGLTEEFTSIGSVRELSDGRVLITDPREGRVVVADFRTGAVSQVGRQGKGPNEYSMAGPLIPLADDSSLMADVLARRWLVFAGPSIVATLAPDTPVIKATRAVARGADARGNVWITVSPQAFDQTTARPGASTVEAADSELVVRVSRATARLDTVTKLRVAVSRRTVRADARGKFQSVGFARAPLSAREEAALFADGWFAVARLDPYRVDWISPAGRVTRGPPLPVTRIKVTSAERDAYLTRQAASRASTSAIPEQMRRDMDQLRDQFPDVFPPFTGPALAAGDGTLWLRRPVSMNFPNYRYDVVDRRGQLIGVVSLDTGERIVAVTATAVYVAWKDADDIERLRRHPGGPW